MRTKANAWVIQQIQGRRRFCACRRNGGIAPRFFAVAVLLLSTGTSLALIRAMDSSLESSLSDSDLIVRGEIISESYPISGSVKWHIATVRVRETLRGPALGQIEFVDGTEDSIQRFKIGEDCLFTLCRSDRTPVFGRPPLPWIRCEWATP